MEVHFEEIIHAFNIPGVFIGSMELNKGNINNTYRLHFYNDEDVYYVLQRVNTYVFRHPDRMMDNIHRVTTHMWHKLNEKGITDISRRTLQFLSTREGLPYFRNDSGFWRAYCFVNKAHTYDFIRNPHYFMKAGAAFGEFQQMLSDFPADTLSESIPQFHDTPFRMQQLRQAVQENRAGRLDEVLDEVKFVLDREEQSGVIIDALKEGRIPYRVTHNDPKINNVLFDDETDEPICIIDLDTVMPGSSLFDFGDAVRSGANAAGEDQNILSLVRFDLSMFEAFSCGFLSKVKGSLTEEEISLLPIAPNILTLELAARFLADYLNGDVYFKVKKPKHNLIRTRNQIELLRQMEKHSDVMRGIIDKYAK